MASSKSRSDVTKLTSFHGRHSPESPANRFAIEAKPTGIQTTDLFNDPPTKNNSAAPTTQKSQPVVSGQMDIVWGAPYCWSGARRRSKITTGKGVEATPEAATNNLKARILTGYMNLSPWPEQKKADYDQAIRKVWREMAYSLGHRENEKRSEVKDYPDPPEARRVGVNFITSDNGLNHNATDV
jgi:hypothetical protein